MQKGQRNKIGGIKIGGIKIGRTKIGGIKIWWETLSYWVVGTPRVSAKRSMEQKCGIKIGRIKIGGTKIGGIKIGGTKIGGIKIWWGTLSYWVAGPLV